MAKTAVNARSIKSTLRSIKDVPFSGTEIKELEQIQAKGYSARKPLKEEFCDRNDRMMSEVNEYFMKHRRPPVVGKAGSYTRSIETQTEAQSSVPAPKAQVTEAPRVSTTGEIKITFKSMRVEGNTITFEL